MSSVFYFSVGQPPGLRSLQPQHIRLEKSLGDHLNLLMKKQGISGTLHLFTNEYFVKYLS